MGFGVGFMVSAREFVMLKGFFDKQNRLVMRWKFRVERLSANCCLDLMCFLGVALRKDGMRG